MFSKDDLSRSRDLAHVRAVISLLARVLDGVTILEVAEGLNRSTAGLSRLANKLDRKCNSEPLLKQEIIFLKNALRRDG